MVAIDLTPLSVADAPPVTKRPELHLDSQTLDELFAPELWSALAPGLDGAEDAAPFEVAAGDVPDVRIDGDGAGAVEGEGDAAKLGDRGGLRGGEDVLADDFAASLLRKPGDDPDDPPEPKSPATKKPKKKSS